MTESYTVFVAEQDPAVRAAIAEQCRQREARVLEFANGQECLDALSAGPDILLLNTELPGMDGATVCRSLRAEDFGRAQVIFMAANDDPETRLLAYSAGGDHFLVQPCAPEELEGQLRAAERAVLNSRHWFEEARNAQLAALTALSSWGDLGVMLEFMNSSFSCRAREELAALLLQALEAYGLVLLCQIRCNGMPGGLMP
jgi:DNA-binding response OmpR family regulator